MNNQDYYSKIKEKEERLTKSVKKLLKRSGFNIERVSISDNKKGPDIVADYKNGTVIIEIKAFHKRNSGLSSAFKQVREYADEGDEKWVISTTDVEPLYIPEDIKLFLGKDILSKLEKGGIDTWGVKWVRETEIKRDPKKFKISKNYKNEKLNTSDNPSYEFFKASDIEKISGGDISKLGKDNLSLKIIKMIDSGDNTIPKISERLDEDPTIIESKIIFLKENKIIYEV